MAPPFQLRLTDAQVAELTVARDRHPKPYLRERASAILQVAAGHSLRWVAHYGLLKPRQAETVGRWVQAYLGGGLAGLQVAQGSGRKPAFSPSPAAVRAPETRCCTCCAVTPTSSAWPAPAGP